MGLRHWRRKQTTNIDYVSSYLKGLKSLFYNRILKHSAIFFLNYSYHKQLEIKQYFALLNLFLECA